MILTLSCALIAVLHRVQQKLVIIAGDVSGFSQTFSGVRLLAMMKAPAWVAATTLRETTSLKAGSAAL